VDFGLKISSRPVASNNVGTFIVGLEDFEVFHIWRGVKRNGTRYGDHREVSKEGGVQGASHGWKPARLAYS